MKLFLRIAGGPLDGTRLLFPPGQYLFGRGVGCHVLFAASSIASRRHCLLLVTEEGVILRDLSSRNGTTVNKKRIFGEQPLSEGDRIVIGETTFQVEVTADQGPEAELEVEVSGKPLGETIESPFDRTDPETKRLSH